jgi:hypothetical protein
VATKTLQFKFLGDATAALKSIHSIEKATGKLADGFGKLGGIIGVSLGAKAIYDFGKGAVTAFLDAEVAQAKLSDAFARFPALADTNQKALAKLNSALALKTGFDDDATASGQAVLAQYGLTGAQVTKLTPLLQDYARKTGQLLPDAASSLGKALLGQGRALKEVGIDFKDTNTLTGNFDQLVSGLTTKVGGYAEVWGTTAAGKFEIFNTRLGEVQESIGKALLPALGDLVTALEIYVVPALEGASDWMTNTGIPAFRDFKEFVKANTDVLVPAGIAAGVLATALGGVAIAQGLVNVAMAANPIGLVILGLYGLIAVATLVALNFNEISKVFYSTIGSLFAGFVGMVAGSLSNLQSFINGILGMMRPVIDFINGIFGALGMSQIKIPVSLDISSGATSFAKAVEATQKIGANTGVDGLLMSTKFDQRTTTNERMSGRGGGGGASFGAGGAGLATGGLVKATPGGRQYTIGEGGVDEAVIPLSRAGLSSAGLGGQTVFNLSGIMTTNRAETARMIRELWQEQIKQGTIPRGSLA